MNGTYEPATAARKSEQTRLFKIIESFVIYKTFKECPGMNPQEDIQLMRQRMYK
jgi:hypothetical protein